MDSAPRRLHRALAIVRSEYRTEAGRYLPIECLRYRCRRREALRPPATPCANRVSIRARARENRTRTQPGTLVSMSCECQSFSQQSGSEHLEPPLFAANHVRTFLTTASEPSAHELR